MFSLLMRVFSWAITFGLGFLCSSRCSVVRFVGLDLDNHASAWRFAGLYLWNSC